MSHSHVFKMPLEEDGFGNSNRSLKVFSKSGIDFLFFSELQCQSMLALSRFD